MEVKIKDLLTIYNEEIKKNVKNKRKLYAFEKHKMEYLCEIKSLLEKGKYDGGKYNIFLVVKPKIRVIMSQSIFDKVINHYVARFILIPNLSKYLNERNCATRKKMGTSYAIDLFKKDIEYYKRYSKFYFLKLDIEKYFYNIDHNILLNMIKDDLSLEEYNLIKVILNSTNLAYVNKTIKQKEEKYHIILPKYEKDKGLPIGNMTSQFLAIFYLSKLQHYIRHNLHLKFVNYMDDYIIIHEDKQYLQKSLNIIKNKLESEYKLKINKDKTQISSAKTGIVFLGYNFKIINNKTIIKFSRARKKGIKKGVKQTVYLYKNTQISFKQLFSSIENYKYGSIIKDRYVINNILDKYFYG